MLRSHRIALVLGGLVLAVALAATYAVAGNGGGNPTNAPVGPDGPSSVAGTAAGMPPTAQVLYAVVNGDGTVARGLPKVGPLAPTAIHLGTGTYQVDFYHDVTGCAHVGTIGLSSTSGSSAPGFTGALTDLGFHLSEAC